MKAKEYFFVIVIGFLAVFFTYAYSINEESNLQWSENLTCKDLAEWIVGSSMKNTIGVEYEILAIDKIIQINELDDEKIRCKAVALTSQGRTNINFNLFRFSGQDYWEVWEVW